MNDIFNSALTIITAVVGFGILVFFHELGHFIVAKLFKIKVEVFSIGWGPKLIGFQRNETLYQIAWFPIIGGYCKFKGDELTDKMEEVTKDPNTFYGAKPYKRLLVAFCGPFMNYIIAILFLAILATGSYKEEYLPAKIVLSDDFGTVKNSPSPAKIAGFLTGDEIIKMNNTPVTSFNDMRKFLFLNGEKEIAVSVKRDDGIKTIKFLPKWSPEQLMAIIGVGYYLDPVIKYSKENKLINYLGLKDKDVIIGIDDDYANMTSIKIGDYLSSNFTNNKKAVLHIKRGEQTLDKEIIFNEINHEIGLKDFGLSYYIPERFITGKSFIPAITDGFKQSNEIIQMTAIGLYALIFKPKKNVQDQMGGPIKMGFIIGQTTIEASKVSLYMGIRNFFYIISLISLGLAFTNLLPIPAVDGGHIILNLYEIITRKAISLKIIYVINMIGFGLIISLFLLITFFDISFFMK